MLNTYTRSLRSIALGKWKDAVFCLRYVLVKLEILLSNSIHNISSVSAFPESSLLTRYTLRWRTEFLEAAGDRGVRRFFDWEEDEERMKQNPLLRVFLKHKY